MINIVNLTNVTLVNQLEGLLYCSSTQHHQLQQLCSHNYQQYDHDIVWCLEHYSYYQLKVVKHIQN